MTFVLRSRRVVFPDGVRPASLRIEGERIAAILPYEPIPVSCRVEDVGERVVMPGLVDPHVHINEPRRAASRRWSTCR
jgi:allantoinase